MPPQDNNETHNATSNGSSSTFSGKEQASSNGVSSSADSASASPHVFSDVTPPGGKVFSPGGSSTPISDQTHPPVPSLSSPLPVENKVVVGDFGSVSQLPNNPSSSGQPVVGHIATPKRSKKKVILLSSGALVLIVAILAGIFLWYLPNRPENIWKAALSNTGKGYDKLIAYSKQQQAAKYKGFHDTGSMKITTPTQTFTGSLTADYDGTNAKGTLKMSSGLATLSIDALSTKQPSNNNPDIYLRASGINSFSSLLSGASSGLGSRVNSVDGKWIAIDHTYLDKLDSQVKSLSGQTSQTPQITENDVITSLQTLGDVSKQYILTSDPSKSVTKVLKNVGREKLDNRSVYHFKVGFNKNNLIAYINALHDTLPTTKLGQYLQKQSSALVIDGAFGALKDSINHMSDQTSVEVYVDMKTRLIRTVRVLDSKDPANNYLDFIVNYVGGKKYPFAISFHNKSDNSTIIFTTQETIDANDNSIDLGVNFSLSHGSTVDTLVNVDFKSVPTNNTFTITAPQQTITLTKALSDLGLLDAYNALFDPNANSLLPIVTQPAPAPVPSAPFNSQ